MDATSSLAIVNTAITSLTGYFTAALPVLIPIVIAVFVLFGGIGWLKSLWHRRV